MSPRAQSFPVDPPVVSAPPPAWTSATTASGLELLRRIAGWPGLCWLRRDLLLISVHRDLQARFRGTLFGFAWVLAHPLLLFAVYAFIFTHLLGIRLSADGSTPAGAMGVYMFTGTLAWSAFADALSRSTSCIVDNRNLVQKVRFPSELLPLQIGLSSLVTFLAGLIAFQVFTACSSVWPAPGLRLLAWAPLLLLLQLLLTTGLGLALAAIHVRFRDTQPFVAVLLTVWMFATPIFWVPSPEVLPGIEPWLPIVEANPLHHLIYCWRELMMSGEPAIAFTGDFGASLVRVALWALGVFVLGSWVFFRRQAQLADEV